MLSASLKLKTFRWFCCWGTPPLHYTSPSLLHCPYNYFAGVLSLQSQSQSIYPPSLVYIHPRLYKPQLRGCWSSSHGRSRRSWRCRWRSDSLFLTAFFVWRSPEVVFRRDLFLYALIKLNIHCPGWRFRIWSTRRWLEIEDSIHSLPWLILLVIT